MNILMIWGHHVSRLWVLGLALSALLLTLSDNAHAQAGKSSPYAAQWQRITALRRHQPTSRRGEDFPAPPTPGQQRSETEAVQIVQQIRQQARLGHQPLDYLRAMQDPSQRNDIARLEAELPDLTFPARPVVHSMLGEAYASYLRQRHYRDALSDNPPSATTRHRRNLTDDLAAWSDAELVSAGIRHYRASVLDAPARQLRLPLWAVPGIRAARTADGQATQPTLYDCLVHRAAIVRLGVGDAPPPTERYVQPETAAQDDLAAFALQPLERPRLDTLSTDYHVLWVWQRYSEALLAGPATPTQRATAELERLLFVQRCAASVRVDSLVLGALRRGARQYAAIPASAGFQVAMARFILRKSPTEALALCRAAEQRFPRSIGGRQAAVLGKWLIIRIASQNPVGLNHPFFSLTLPAIQSVRTPWTLEVTATRVSTLYCRAYRVPVGGPHPRNPSYQSEAMGIYERVSRQTPAAIWAQPLKPCPDSACKSPQLMTCPGLAAGRYLVVASTAESAGKQSVPGVATQFVGLTISDLAVLERPGPAGQPVERLLLDRRRGPARPDVVWQAVYEASLPGDTMLAFHLGPALRRDSLGWQREVPTRTAGTADSAQLVGLLAHRGDDSLLVRSDQLLPAANPANQYQPPATAAPAVTATVYTNQAVYQPGQTLHYNVLLTSAGPVFSGQPLAGRADTITITDNRGRVLRREPFVSSANGTFAGRLVLPDTIVAPTPGAESMVSLKASRATVTAWQRAPMVRRLPANAPAPLALAGPGPVLQAGQVVQVRGQVRLGAGAVWWQGNREIHYRIMRRFVVLDTVLSGELANIGSLSPELLRAGVLRTKPDGSFEITFTADIPALNPEIGGQPGYQYRVLAGVESGGEAGVGVYVANVTVRMQELALEGPAQVNRDVPASFSLRAFPTQWRAYREPARGWLRLFRVPEPAATTGLSPSPTGPTKAGCWRECPRTLAAAWPFDTGVETQVQLPRQVAKMPPGRYLLVATTRDSLGQTAAAQWPFSLYSPADAALPYPAADWFVAPPATVRADGRLELLLGSAQAGPTLLEASVDDSLVQWEWLQLVPGQQYRWSLALPRAWHNRQVQLRTTRFQDGQLYPHAATVAVTDGGPLSLHLGPTGTVQVQDHTGRPVAAELLVTAVSPRQELAHGPDDHELPAPMLPVQIARNPLPDWKLSAQPVWASAFGPPDERHPDCCLGAEQASMQGLYWPLEDQPLLQRPSRSFLDRGDEDSVALEKFRNLILSQNPADFAAESSALSAQLRELFQEASYGPLPPERQLLPSDSPYWQPAVPTNRQGVAKLPSLAGAGGQRLLVLAHTKQGAAGQLSQWLAPAAPLRAQVRAWLLAPGGRQWLVTAEVRNDGLATRRGHVKLALPAEPKSSLQRWTTPDQQRQPFRLAAGQRLVLSWRVTADTAAGPKLLTTATITGAGAVRIVCIMP